MTRSLKKVARTFETVRFLYNLYLCPLVVTELLYEKKSSQIEHYHYIATQLIDKILFLPQTLIIVIQIDYSELSSKLNYCVLGRPNTYCVLRYVLLSVIHRLSDVIQASESNLIDRAFSSNRNITSSLLNVVKCKLRDERKSDFRI